MTGPAQTLELEWNRRPLAGLLRLAWPIAVSMVGYTVMTLTGTAFVGRLGASALAGVGLGGIACFTMLVFAMGLLRGVKVLVSQAVGAGREGDLGLYVAAGIIWALGLGVIEATLGQIVSLWVPALAASPEAGALAAVYLRIRILSAPVILVYVVLQETSYGRGRSRSPMVATLVGCSLNIVLDALFIYGFGWGVAGAAWAAVVSHIAETVVLALFCRDLLAAAWRLRDRVRERMRDVWQVGLPTAMQFLVEVGAFAVLTVAVSRIGEVDMAAHQIALHAIHFSFLPAFAIGEAASVMAGQAVGAGRDDLVRAIAGRAMAIAGSYTALCTVVVATGAGIIASIFTTEPDVQARAVTLLYIATLFQIGDAANIVARCVLRGTGDVKFAAAIGMAAAWLATPTMAWWLGVHLGWGAPGGWIGICIEVLLGAAILWTRLLRGGWRVAAVRSRAIVTAPAIAPDQAAA